MNHAAKPANTSIHTIPLRDLTHTPAQLHIASLVAHVRPEQLAATRNWLLTHASTHNAIHIEIHAEDRQGKFVLVTESEEEKAIVNFLDDLRAQPGVLNAALVYHEYLSAQDLQESAQNSQPSVQDAEEPTYNTQNDLQPEENAQ